MKPAIVQDARDGRVLMLAWMDDEAERLTRETGEAWFWSRSRERLQNHASPVSRVRRSASASIHPSISTRPSRASCTIAA